MNRRLRRILCLAAVILLVTAMPLRAYAEPEGETRAEPEEETVQETQEVRQPFDESSISAYYAILYNLDDGTVLAEKNADAKMYPASTTKTMTCILALEEWAGRLDETVTVGDEVTLISWDSSKINLVPGEVMTMRDLLYGLMLSSGNDAANAIAVAVSGSIEGFVDLMNAKAQALEMTGTHYMNAHGLSDENHYTTARDMMKLVQYAEKNEEFRTITSTLTHTVAPTQLRPEGYTFINSNLLLHEEKPETYMEGAFGVKTGFTNAAGHCLLAVVERDGLRLGASIYMSGEAERYTDAITLLDYGFSCYEAVDLKALLTDRLPATVKIANAAPEDLMRGQLLLEQQPDEGSGTVMLLKEDAQLLRERVSEIHFVTEPALSGIEAPIAQGESVGTYRYELDGEVLLQGSLIATRPVKEMTPVVPWQDVKSSTRVGFWRFTFYPVATIFVLVGIMLLVQHAFLKQYQRNRKQAANKAA